MCAQQQNLGIQLSSSEANMTCRLQCLDETAFDSGSSTYRAEPKAAGGHVLVQARRMEPPYTAIAQKKVLFRICFITL